MTPKEFKHIAPILANLKGKGTGFKHPKSYFEEIDSQIKSRLFVGLLPDEHGYKVLSKSLKEKSIQTKENSSLSAIRNVPKDYFDTFEKRLSKRLDSETLAKSNLFKRYWSPMAIAASLVLFISLFNPFSQGNEMTANEMEAYFEEGILEVDSYEIAAIYSLELESLTLTDQISTDDIESYLLSEIDESILYN